MKKIETIGGHPMKLISDYQEWNRAEHRTAYEACFHKHTKEEVQTVLKALGILYTEIQDGHIMALIDYDVVTFVWFNEPEDGYLGFWYSLNTFEVVGL